MSIGTFNGQFCFNRSSFKIILYNDLCGWRRKGFNKAYIKISFQSFLLFPLELF
jgi:hypothetical protein